MERILRPSLQNLTDKKDLVGVEIGVFTGRNSKDILTMLDVKKLYLIDPYRECSLFEKSEISADLVKQFAYEKLKEFQDKIVWIEDVSDSVIYYIDDELDFVYIDGDHKYDGVIRDLNNFYKLVKVGGLIAGHDFDKETDGNQVVRAVHDFFKPYNKVIYSDLDPYSNGKTNDWWVFK